MFSEVSQEEIIWFRKKVIRWGDQNFADFPWRQTNNPWHALVAEIMLQRTKAEQVVPTFLNFCNRYPAPSDYLADKTSDVFGSLGLIWREALLQDLARILKDKNIPSDKEELLSLPGVGDYIAAAFRSMYLNIRDTIIDSNVVRIYGRYFGFETDGETRRKKWFIELANRVTPPRTFRDFNYSLIDFTREICKPTPLCSRCPLNSRCRYYQETQIRLKSP